MADPREIDRLRAQVLAVEALTVHDDGGPRIQGDRVLVADIRAALAAQPRDSGERSCPACGAPVPSRFHLCVACYEDAFRSALAPWLVRPVREGYPEPVTPRG